MNSSKRFSRKLSLKHNRFQFKICGQYFFRGINGPYDWYCQQPKSFSNLILTVWSFWFLHRRFKSGINLNLQMTIAFDSCLRMLNNVIPLYIRRFDYFWCDFWFVWLWSRGQVQWKCCLWLLSLFECSYTDLIVLLVPLEPKNASS